MNVLTYNPDALTKYTVIPLGRACECRATRVDFSVAGWLNRFPGGEIVLYIKDPNGELYLGTITTADGVASWMLRETDTKVPGYGSLELALIGVNGEKKLSAVATTKLEASLVESETDAAYMQPWIEQAAEIQANTEGAAKTAATHAATATQAASNAVEAMDAADNAAARAEAAADAAYDTAVGAEESAKAAEASEDAAADHAAAASDSAQAAAAAESAAAGHVQETLAAREDAAVWAESAARSADESAKHAGEALAAAAMLEQAGRCAPAIECEASGDVAVVTDAAARDALHVVSTITALQAGEGDPSPDNVRPITGRAAVGLWHGATYDASAAGTMSAALPEEVYGGTLDWVTGLLTVTHKMVTLTSASVYWATGSNNFWISVEDRSENSTLLSNRFVTTTRTATQMYEGQMRLSTTYPRVVFANPGNALSVDEWKAQIDATPIQLVYELAEPYTIQLDPHTVTMLRGSTALWSDTGSTAVAYVADTKTYIDNAVAALAAAYLNT